MLRPAVTSLALIILSALGLSSTVNAMLATEVPLPASDNPAFTCKLSMFGHIVDAQGNVQVNYCSATLIDRNLLLTAAHCVEKITHTIEDQILVECPNENQPLYGVVAATPMPYQGAESDYAFIRLSSNAQKTTPLKPAIDLATLNKALKGSCFISGYGFDKNGKGGTQLTAPVARPVLKNTKKSGASQTLVTSDAQTWAEQGDSGGSLYCTLPDQSQVLVGVTSMKSTLKEVLTKGKKRTVHISHFSIFSPTTTLNWALQNLDTVFASKNEQLFQEARKWTKPLQRPQGRALIAILEALRTQSPVVKIFLPNGRIEFDMLAPLKALALPKTDAEFEVTKLSAEKAWQLAWSAKAIIAHAKALEEALVKYGY